MIKDTILRVRSQGKFALSRLGALLRPKQEVSPGGTSPRGASLGISITLPIILGALVLATIFLLADPSAAANAAGIAPVVLASQGIAPTNETFTLLAAALLGLTIGPRGGKGVYPTKVALLDLDMLIYGTVTPAIAALLEACKNGDEEPRARARDQLKDILLHRSEPLGMITLGNVDEYIREILELNSFTEPYEITRERLKGTKTILTSFYFNRGANFFVFSYKKAGRMRHTFIDTGDPQYRDSILELLRAKGIDPKNIEYIILTHHHQDHSGLADVLLGQSPEAKVLVHPNFRGIIEGTTPPQALEAMWWKVSAYDPSKLQGDVVYLEEKGTRQIGGVDFPVFREIEVAEGIRLEILACPSAQAGQPEHTQDQLFVLCLPVDAPGDLRSIGSNFRLRGFFGDLWLMESPGVPGYRLRALKLELLARLREGTLGSREDRAREENAEAKAALKGGFSWIEAYSGHGPAFGGTELIPESLFAESDIQARLSNGNPGLTREKLLADGYDNFTFGLEFWLSLGYSNDEVAALLARIYSEQRGGSPNTARDRKERRAQLLENLQKLERESREIESRNLPLREITLIALEKIALMMSGEGAEPWAEDESREPTNKKGRPLEMFTRRDRKETSGDDGYRGVHHKEPEAIEAATAGMEGLQGGAVSQVEHQAAQSGLGAVFGGSI